MAESDVDVEKVVDVPQMRKALKKLGHKMQRRHDKYSKILEANNPAVIELQAIEDAYKEIETWQQKYETKSAEVEEYEESEEQADRDLVDADGFHEMMLATKFILNLLASKKIIHRAMTLLEAEVDHAEEAFMANPETDHSDALINIQECHTKLSTALEDTSLMNDDPLFIQAQDVKKKARLLQGKVGKLIKPDIGPVLPAAPVKSTFKVDPVSVPTFSGRTEDWLPFWRMFKKAIHDKPDLDDDIRLTYLLRAIKDKTMSDSYSERVDDVGAYKMIVGELQAEFDKPRWMHRRY